MKRVLVGGLLVAVLATLAVLVCASLGFALADLNELMFGAGAGAVLGLIATKSPLARIGGFLIGFVLTWVLYAVSAQFFPDASSGVILQVLVTLVVLTVIAALVHRGIPFWSILLGLVAFAGAYQYLYSTNKPGFIADSVASAGGALFSAALGLLAIVIADVLPLGSHESDNPGAAKPQFAASTSTPAKG